MQRTFLLVGLSVGVAAMFFGAAWRSIRHVAPRTGVPVAAVARGRFLHRVMAEGQLQEVKATAITVPGQGQDSFKIAWIAQEGISVHQGDVLVRFDPSEVEKDLDEGKADLAVVDNKIQKTEIETGATLRALDRSAADAGLLLSAAKEFQGRDPDVFARTKIQEDAIDTALAEKTRDHSLGVRQDSAVVARVALDLLALERDKVRKKIETAERIRQALVVHAPHDGIVLFSTHDDGRPLVVGDPLWAGGEVARLPRLDRVEAVVYVLEADAGGLAVSRTATVVVEAAPDTTVSAHVKRLDALPKPRIHGVPVQYFETVLELDRIDPSFMKPGQRVRATIVLEDLPGVLILPREAVFDRGNRSFVYRSTEHGFETADVRVGSTSPSQVVIEEGLRESDLVALRDPTRSLDEILPVGGLPDAPPEAPAPSEAPAPHEARP